MQRRSLVCAVSLLVLSFLLFLQPGSQADTYYRAATNGRYYYDGIHLTQFNVSVYKTYSDATGITSVWGSLSVIASNFAVSTTVQSEDFSNLYILGLYYKHAVVTSNTFNFTDPVTQQRVPAHMVIELTQFGPTGQGGIKIIRNSDNAILLKSSPDGLLYGELPFLSGSVTINM